MYFFCRNPSAFFISVYATHLLGQFKKHKHTKQIIPLANLNELNKAWGRGPCPTSSSSTSTVPIITRLDIQLHDMTPSAWLKQCWRVFQNPPLGQHYVLILLLDKTKNENPRHYYCARASSSIGGENVGEPISSRLISANGAALQNSSSSEDTVRSKKFRQTTAAARPAPASVLDEAAVKDNLFFPRAE